jgi:hypothetical protein
MSTGDSLKSDKDKNESKDKAKKPLAEKGKKVRLSQNKDTSDSKEKNDGNPRAGTKSKEKTDELDSSATVTQTTTASS